MALQLPSSVRAHIASEARRAYPRECCGLLEGVRDAAGVAVTAAHAARNLSERPDRFEIDPADQFRILRAARARGTAIVGCYHSHPNGLSTPSPHDRAAAAEEHFIWVIAALDSARAAPSIDAFEFVSGAFRPLSIEASIASAADTSASR